MKILCTVHEDTTPSMEVYPNGYGHCFACGAHVYLGDNQEVPKVEPKEPENIQEAYKYINSCSEQVIRGLPFLYDKNGYFITWPDESYYKYRRNSKEGPRYLAPRGHKQPLLYSGGSVFNNLVIIEGEINALSVIHSGIDAVSPGSAGNFTNNKDELIKLAKKYRRVLIWTDKDGPGIKAIWEIAPYIENCITHISELDANDLLVRQGQKALTGYIERLFNE